MQRNEPESGATAYAARILQATQAHEVDPNVYVYTAEFARRFQMPPQWVSEELVGADAVAFRVVAAEKTCGWVGNPQACR